MSEEIFDALERYEYLQTFTGQKLLPPDGEEVFVNSLYQVNKRPELLENGELSFWHLSIKRRDKAPGLPWRHKQYIKNDLCGPETTAIEVFPPESKLVDTANQYHLWVFPDPDLLPFIWQTRFVAEQSTFDGAVQEPWQEDRKPGDLLDQETLEQFCKDAREQLGYKEIE